MPRPAAHRINLGSTAGKLASHGNLILRRGNADPQAQAAEQFARINAKKRVRLFIVFRFLKPRR